MEASEAQRVLAPADLRARRVALGLSQAALATTLGITANTVARWERGELRIANPSQLASALARIERAALEGGTTQIRARRHNLPADTSRRLAQVKRSWDPDDLIIANHSVALATS